MQPADVPAVRRLRLHHRPEHRDRRRPPPGGAEHLRRDECADARRLGRSQARGARARRAGEGAAQRRLTVDDASVRRLDLRLHATRTPSHPAIVCGDVRLSYAELEALANRIANVFRGLGLQRGAHVASLLGNRPEALAVAWGAYRCGLYLTPLATTLAPAELAYLVGDCDARAVIVDTALEALAAPLADDSAGGIHRLSFGGSIAGFTPIEPLIATAGATPHEAECAGALMVYTSGTTGAPKGVHRPLPPPDFAGTPAFAADLHTLFGL
ncbi:MAG: hypothetical protein E6H79_09610, partial [Betaproteobacteria bacterium]